MRTEYTASEGLIDLCLKDSKRELNGLGQALQVIDVEQKMDLNDYDRYADLIANYKDCDFKAVLEQLRAIKERIDARRTLIGEIQAMIRAIPMTYLAGARPRFSKGDHFEVIDPDDPDNIWTADYEPDFDFRHMQSFPDSFQIWYYPAKLIGAKYLIEFINGRWEIVASLSLIG